MALINCPNCIMEISDRAASCPHCRIQLTPAFPASGAGVMENRLSFSGSVFDFGVFNCLKAEGKNFWMRRWGKSVYDSKAHGGQPLRRISKTKGQIMRTWVLGIFGILGMHYFPVGRFITGSIRFLYGALMLVAGIAATFQYRAAQDVDPLRIMLLFLVAAFIPAGIDLIMLLSGKFRDVFRSHVQ